MVAEGDRQYKKGRRRLRAAKDKGFTLCKSRG